MASAYALNAAGGNATATSRSNKKKSHHSSNKSWDKNADIKTQAAGQLFPKIGSNASPPLPSLPSVSHSGSDSSKPSSNFHGVVVLPLPLNANSNSVIQDPSALPKLSGKGSYSSAHSNAPITTSSASSAASSQSSSSSNVTPAVSSSSLPAVSPRTDASAALTVRILNNITGATAAASKDKGDQSSKPPKHKEKEKEKDKEREKETKSTKKKKKEPRRSDEGPAEKNQPPPAAVAAAVPVPAPVAAAALDVNDDDDGEYDYDDETYAATSPSSTRNVAAAPIVQDVSASEKDLSPAKDTSPNMQQRKVGPKVQKPRIKPNNDSFSQTSEINEELDANFAATASSSSFHMPVASPSPRAKSNEGHQEEQSNNNSTNLHRQTLHRLGNEQHEVEEEAQAQLHTTLSPQALRKALQQQNPDQFSSPAFSRSIGYGSDGFEEEEENVAALLAGSPASTHRRFPTALSSLQTPQAAGAATTLKSPAGKANPLAAKANKKKGVVNPTPMKSGASLLAVNSKPQQISSAKKKLLSAANSHGGGGAKSSSQKSTHGNSPPKAAAASNAADDPSDNYSDVDWRNETTRDIHSIAQQGTDSSDGNGNERHAWNESVVLSKEQSAELPDEVIRFTLMPDTIQSFYAQNASKLPHHQATGGNSKQQSSSFAKQASSSRGLFNTTLEFSRSSKVGEKLSARLAHAAHKPAAAVGNFAYAEGETAETEGELQCETQWVPVYSTTLAPLEESLPSVFTIDRATFGHDPEESLLIQLWNNAYGDVTDDDDDDATDDEKKDGRMQSLSLKTNGGNGSGSSGNLNRTLLAEFRASFKDLSAQNSYVDPTEAATARRSKTPRMNVPPPVTAVAPRSALKAPKDPNSNGNNPDNPPPPKLHVRFFDQVEIFRLSDRLDRTLELSGPVVASSSSSHRKDSTSPSSKGNSHREKEKDKEHTAEPIEPLPDLNSLILSEQAFQRRIRMVQTPLVVTTPNGHKNNPVLQYPLLPAAKKPAPLKKKASKENDSGEANGVSGNSGSSTPSSHGTPPLPPFLHTKLHVRGCELVPMSFQSGSSNPQLEILLLLPPHGWILLYKSEVQFNTLEPSFKPVVISFPSISSLMTTASSSSSSSITHCGIGAVFTSQQAQAILDAPLVFRLAHFDADMVASSPTAASAVSSTNISGIAAENNVIGGVNESLTANGGERMGQAITSLRVLMPSAAAFHTPGHAAVDTVEGANNTLPAPQSFILSNPARQKLSSKRTSCGRLIVNFLPPSTTGPSLLTPGVGSHANSRAGSAASSRGHNNAGNAKKNPSNASTNNSRPTSKQALK